MDVVKEKIIKIELYSKPLSKYRYSYDDVKKFHIAPRHEGSGLLIEEVKKRERAYKKAEASGILQKKPTEEEEWQNEIDQYITKDTGLKHVNPLPRPDEENTKKKKFRSLNPFANIEIFDYSEVKEAELEQKVNDLINKDGYYDEVKPYDVNEDYDPNGHKIDRRAMLLIILLIALIGGIIIYIKEMF